MKDLSQKQINFLKNHKSVERITSKQVIFSFEFKLKAVQNYLKGRATSQIFIDEGLDFLPKKMMTNSVLRWRDRYNLDGEKGLKEKKKGRRQIHLEDSSNLSYEELLAKVEYLEQENDFLKKLKALGDE